MADRREMPWWGWGDPDHDRELPESVRLELERRFGALEVDRPETSIDRFAIPPSRLPKEALDDIRDSLTDGTISDAGSDRVLRGAGKSYPDLVRMRSGQPGLLPDLVVRPADADEVAAVLDACARHRTAVIPFGGGTSVVGGLTPIAAGSGSIALDLSLLSGLVGLDRESRIGTFLAGTSASVAEAAIAQEGLTIGHFPQSYLHATIGGFAATRSAGQASTGYGRFDSNVLGLKMVTPRGPIDLPAMPGTAAGPGLRSLLVGSEGTLGVMTEVSLQLAEAPRATSDRAWIVDGFGRGRDLLRRLEQEGCAPAVARLSDPEETAVGMTLSARSRARRLFARYALAKGGAAPCLLIACFEGTTSSVSRQAADATEILRSGGARSLGGAAARAWRRGRYDGPYLRDSLMDLGLLVDTLETAAPWSGLEALHAGVTAALTGSLRAHGGEPIVMCHVSHLYAGGASLYFTFAGRQPERDPEARTAAWSVIKRAACEAIVANGGTITHHHAIGTDHSEWMPTEVGDRSLAALAALKRELDPAGIMNPGKLLPAEH